MAKDRNPADEPSALATQTMEQARNAVDTYFDYLKKAVSAAPTGGTEYGEKLKSCAEANLATTHEFVRVCPDTLGRITNFSKHEPN